MTVFIYVDNRKQVGDKDHLKVFANQDAAERWFQENDPEGVGGGGGEWGGGGRGGDRGGKEGRGVRDARPRWRIYGNASRPYLITSRSMIRSLLLPSPSLLTWAMLILGFGGVGFMAYRRRTRPLSQPDQTDIANTETAFGRSFCLVRCCSAISTSAEVNENRPSSLIVSMRSTVRGTVT